LAAIVGLVTVRAAGDWADWSAVALAEADLSAVALAEADAVAATLRMRAAWKTCAGRMNRLRLEYTVPP
jgi:hypothetical protein